MPLSQKEIADLGLYTLDENHRPVIATDLLAWAAWFETDSNRIVTQEYYGPYRISTVFLGIDHNFGRDWPPTLFETMIFSGGIQLECKRCATWEEAVTQHKKAVWRLELELGQSHQPS